MNSSLDSEPNIAVLLKGGLGNQLFQYAMGRALSCRSQLPLVLDLSWFDQVKHEKGGRTTVRDYALAPFNIAVETQYLGVDQTSSSGLFPRAMKRLRSSFSVFQKKQRIYREKRFEFDPLAYDLKGSIYLDGYWQSPKYFEDISQVIKFEIGTPRNLSDATKIMMDAILNSDSVCLHIRRGDYVTNPDAAMTHGVCSMEYYDRGLDLVSKDLNSPSCFVFTDDPSWVRENLRLRFPFVVVDINGPNAAHEDLWLMSACKRFVIANSSLSWWGAWLSDASDKMIIAPKNWFADESKDTSDLIPVDWIRV